MTTGGPPALNLTIMKKIVLTHGLVSGLALATLTAIMVPLCMNANVDLSYSQLVGYASMVLAFMAVFLGIRAYREKQGGAITFGRAFQVGILITLVTCAIYVIGWEIVFWGFLPDFGDKYAAYSLAKMQAGGASAQELAKATAEMERFKVLYRNPLFNVGMTFLEVFPVGLVVTLVSAAILRRKASPGAPATVATA
jgi:hypothetical protein